MENTEFKQGSSSTLFTPDTSVDKTSTSEAAPDSMPTPVTDGETVTKAERISSAYLPSTVTDHDTYQLTDRPISKTLVPLQIDDTPMFGHEEDYNNSAPVLYTEELSEILLARGLNVINPMGLMSASFSNDSTFDDVPGADKLTAAEAFWDGFDNILNNAGPSISTKGCTKLAAVSSAMSQLGTSILNYFNRKTPFSELPVGLKAMSIAAYERDLLTSALPFYAVSWLHSYAESVANAGISLSPQWKILYNPELRSSMAAALETLLDLPIFDLDVHKAMHDLTRLHAASETMEFPPRFIMQDVGVRDFTNNTANIPVAYGSGTLKYRSNLKSVYAGASDDTLIPPTLFGWVALFANASADRLINTFNYIQGKATDIKVQYQQVIATIQQLISKGAMDEHYLAEYIPAESLGDGQLKVQTMKPAYSYAYHERVEYAPACFGAQELSDGSATTVVNLLTILPREDASATLGDRTIKRPAGVGKESSVWGTKEIAEIGLWRLADVVCLNGSKGGTRFTIGSHFSDATPALGGSTEDPSESWTPVFADAVSGNFYIDALMLLTSSLTGISKQPHCFMLHGLSNVLKSQNEDAQNTLNLPALGGTALTNDMGDFIVQNDILFGRSVNAYGGAGTSYINGEGTRRFLLWLQGYFQLHRFCLPAEADVGNSSIPYIGIIPYYNSKWYAIGLATLNNAIVNDYIEMVPTCRYLKGSNK